MQKIYRFVPLFKETIWGGNRILPFKGLPSDSRQIGESWEVSGVQGQESVVADGPDAGKTLGELCAAYGAALMGTANAGRYGTFFPLLIKFIDAASPLSVQVHPNDEVARRRHGSPGKTEMWYVMKAAPGAYLLDGFSRVVTPDEYEARVADHTLPDVLRRCDVREGDVYFLPAGRVHSIGPGCFICEIQQASDITYRIYDFGRTDSQGRPRQLHVEEARDVIDYTVPEPEPRPDETADTRCPVVSCPYFTTAAYYLTAPLTCDYTAVDSFVVLIGLEGSCKVTCGEGTVTLEAGHTLLLPAEAEGVTLEPSGKATILECYV